jgi:putative ABC transport system permease protein
LIQFTTFVSFLGCALIVSKQIGIITNIAPLYSHDKVLIVPAPNEPTLSEIELFKKKLYGLPFVESVSLVGTNSLPTSEISPDVFRVTREGRNSIELLPQMFVDESYFDLLQVQMIAGHGFSENDKKLNRVIVNEALVEKYDWRLPTKERIWYGETEFEVIGVVSDFNDRGMVGGKRPLIIRYNTDSPEQVLVRVSKIETNKTAQIKEIWNSSIKDAPFEATLMTDQFLDLFSEFGVMKSFLLLFTIMAIIISSLGLYGIVSIDLVHRKKELAIRRLLGAEFWSIVEQGLLRYGLLVFASAIVSIPLILWAMQEWLVRFALKAGVSLESFVYPIAILCLITTLTVLIHTRGVWRTISIENLKSE